MTDTNLPTSSSEDAQVGETATDAAPQYLPRFSGQRLTPRQWKIAILLIAINLVIILVVLFSTTVTVPYRSIAPGNVYNLSGSVDIAAGGLQTYPAESDLSFVTIRRSEKLSVWQFVFDSLDSRIDIVSDESLTQGRTPEELDIIGLRQMSISQKTAVDNALEYLGLIPDRPTLYPGEMPHTLQCFVPPEDDEDAEEDIGMTRLRAAIRVGAHIGRLFFKDDEYREQMYERWRVDAGEGAPIIFDSILEVNGEPVADVPDVLAAFREAVGGSAAGGLAAGGRAEADVVLTTQFINEETREVVVKVRVGETFSAGGGETDGEGADGEGAETAASPVLAFLVQTVAGGTAVPRNPDGPCAGTQEWYVANGTDWGAIDQIEVSTGEVQGPSAGLALTLSIVDVLTEGNLTGDLQVATTGEIRDGGDVVPVGGVPQKTTAVRNGGYDLFLVPEANYEEAMSAAGEDLRVEQVRTLGEALAVLECLGGDSVSAGPSEPAVDRSQLPACQ